MDYIFEAGKSYQISVEKEGFYPLDTIFNTTGFKYSQKSRLGLMLKPIICYQVKGRLRDKVSGEKMDQGSLRLKALENPADTILVEVNDGVFEFCGQCGKSYSLEVVAKGYFPAKDSFTLDAENCMIEEELRLDLDLELASNFQEGYYKDDSITLNKLKFKGKTIELAEEGLQELQRLVEVLKNIPELEVKILVHTDAKMSHRYNKILSEKRAKMISNYLLEQGIDKERFLVEGHGESKLIDSKDAEKNRRAELRIMVGNLDKMEEEE